MKDINRNADISVDAKCPQCGELMANMGLDFKSPAKNDDKKWQHIKSLYRVGITFHSCGCSGPGYIPEDKENLISYLEKIRSDYQESLTFWRNRTEPENKAEREKDYQRNWQKLSAISNNAKKEGVSNHEGIDYWIKRIHEVEERLRLASK
ncbi:hypothetical protein [Chryseobacterium oranimense]|uniref:hypothetical protein n=1 Tax=Chryseobacterium oranimense TaxID=421058 RepID=UPI0028B1949C|nr:hypothetical protein [Chryseobacterium oranimense]